MQKVARNKARKYAKKQKRARKESMTGYQGNRQRVWKDRTK